MATTYQLQAFDGGCWDTGNVTWDPDATNFDTLQEAEAEWEYWDREGRDTSNFRVVRIENDECEVLF